MTFKFQLDPKSSMVQQILQLSQLLQFKRSLEPLAFEFQGIGLSGLQLDLTQLHRQ
jgi:hypothetical protein